VCKIFVAFDIVFIACVVALTVCLSVCQCELKTNHSVGQQTIELKHGSVDASTGDTVFCHN